MTPKLITQTKNKAVAKTGGQAVTAGGLSYAIVQFLVSNEVISQTGSHSLAVLLMAVLAPLFAWLHNTIPNKDDRQRKAEVKRLTAEAQEDLRNQRLAQAVAQVVSTQIKIDQEPPKSDPPTYV